MTDETELTDVLRNMLPTRYQYLAERLARKIIDSQKTDRDSLEAQPEIGAALKTLQGQVFILESGQQISVGDIQNSHNVAIGENARVITIGDVHLTIQEISDEQRAWSIPPTYQDEQYCPYPGLASFDETIADQFFGREEDIQTFLHLPSRPLMAVTGPSGVGKSSFVRAGLIPAFKQHYGNSICITYRLNTGGELLRDLATFLAQATQRDSETILQALEQKNETLLELLESLHTKETGKVMVVFDQFEELFVGDDTARTHDRQCILDQLSHIDKQQPVFLNILISSRENYFEHPEYQSAAREHLRTVIQTENMRLGGLNDKQLRRAIEQPLERFNTTYETQLRFESGIVELLYYWLIFVAQNVPYHSCNISYVCYGRSSMS